MANDLMAKGQGAGMEVVLLCGFPVIILLILLANIVVLARLFPRKRWMAIGAVSALLVTIISLISLFVFQ